MNTVSRKHHRLELSAVAASAIGYVALSLWFTRKGTVPSPDGLEYAEVARSLVQGHGYTIDLVEIHAGLLKAIRHLHELHGLLHPVVLAALFKLWGPHLELVRIPGIYAVAALAVATYATARSLFGPAAGAIAGALVLIRQELTLDGVLGGDDVGWALFSTLAFLCFLKAIECGKSRWCLLSGLAAALATLEKFSGFVLPAAFGVVLLALPRVRSVVGWSGWGRIAVPVGLAAALYVSRNYLLSGSLAFRFSALDWLAKESPQAYFAYYDAPPSLYHVWSSMGLSRVLELTAHQFRIFLGVVRDEPFALLGGPLSLFYYIRKSATLSWFGLSYTAITLLLVCFFYHVEVRYLFALYPIYFVALSGLLLSIYRQTLVLLPGKVEPLCKAVALVVGSALFVTGFCRVAAVERSVGAVASKKGPCEDAMDFLRTHVGPGESILTSSPWLVAWATGRAAVNAPTNGPDALLTVTNHYEVSWVVDGLPSYATADMSQVLRQLRHLGASVRVQTVHRAAECSVDRLRRLGPRH